MFNPHLGAGLWAEGCGLQCLHVSCPLFLSLMVYSFLCGFLSGPVGQRVRQLQCNYSQATLRRTQIKFQSSSGSVKHRTAAAAGGGGGDGGGGRGSGVGGCG